MRLTAVLLLSFLLLLSAAGCGTAIPSESDAGALGAVPPSVQATLPTVPPSWPTAPAESAALTTPTPTGAGVPTPTEGAAAPTPQKTPAVTRPVESGSPPTLDDLMREIGDLVGKAEGETWNVFVQRLPDGEGREWGRWDVGGESSGSPLVCASLIKLFVMAAVYEQVSLGKLDEKSVEADLKTMITVSDNDAANRLTKLLGGAAAGMAAVNAYAQEIGCGDTQMNRLMLVDNGLQNYTTAQDCGTLLRLVYRGECVSEDASAKMLALLKDQQRRGKIPAGVPAGVVTANKTGELTGLSECDVAIVFTEEGDYILCVLSEPTDNAAAIRTIVAISETVYDYMTAAA
jgi:beta-lactamase class A